MASGAANKIHVLTVDYRGFGYSSGSPTEQGLIIDGISLVNWALEVAHIPPERIVILGQSLGTAVSTAVAEHFTVEMGIEFAGIVLVAAFSDLPTLMFTYKFGNFIPVLSPLSLYPQLQQYFSRRIVDAWPTAARLARLIRHSEHARIVLIHAKNDLDIPWKHSDILFYAAANATTEKGMDSKVVDNIKHHIDLGEAGWVNSWTAGTLSGGQNRIRQEIVRHGGK